MEDRNKFLLVGIILHLIINGLSFPGFTTLRGKVVPGVYWEDQGQPLQLYEKVVPLVFEFRLKSDLWSPFSVAGLSKFKVIPRLYCKSDNKSTSSTPSTSDWSFACPIFYHVNDYLRQYKINYTDIFPTMRSSRYSGSPEGPRFSHSGINFDDCDQTLIQFWKRLSVVAARDISMTEYRLYIEKCNSMPSYFEEKIPDFNNDISSLFDQIKDNFASNFFVNVSNPVDPGVMINNLLGLQSLQLLNTYSELTRIREAVLSCQNQLIPYSLLKATRLDKALQEIRLKLLPLKYSLSVPSLSRLYKAPIADCIFGTTHLVVQILLPVIRQSSNFNLITFHYPQFLYKDQLCQVKTSPDGSGKDVDYVLYDLKSNTLVETDCKLNDRNLCQLQPQDQQSLKPTANKCIYEVLHSSFEGIRNYCSFQCRKQSPEYVKLLLPIVLRVAPSKFVITVNRVTTMLIKCEGKPDELITPQAYGAVEISLPCNCYIMYHAEKFQSRHPCGNFLIMKHIIPEHMVNSSLAKEHKTFLNVPSDNVNFSLLEDQDVDLIDLGDVDTMVTGTKLTFDLKGSTPSPNNKPEDLDGDVHLYVLPGNGANNYTGSCTNHHVYLWTFLAFQTALFFICLVIFYMQIVSLRKKLDYGRSAVCFSVSQMTNLDDNK